jgi:acyl dehydratase
VAEFGDIIRDKNVLHSSTVWNELVREQPHLQANLDAGLIQLDEDCVVTRPLVHGMLVSSIFSSIFSNLSPGCVYLNQSLTFAAPVFVDELVTGRIEITKVRKWRRGGVVVQCDTKVFRSDSVVVNGDANVWLPSGYSESSE